MSPSKIFELKITLQDIKPKIWRTIHVSADTKLIVFHHILQCVMGWNDCHAHQFRSSNNIMYSNSNFQLDDSYRDENKYTISNVICNVGDKMLYQYDFGDGWVHKIELIAIPPVDESKSYPYIVKGANACPPEDCGGCDRYNFVIELMKNPNLDQEEYTEFMEWMSNIGGFNNKEKNGFDPKLFDKELHQKNVLDIFA